MSNAFKKLTFIVAIIALIISIKVFGLDQYLTLSFMQSNLERFRLYYQDHSAQTIALFMSVYILSTALSIPGATILTLMAGGLFGLLPGLVIVSFASTLGATLSFLSARFLLRDYVQNKFANSLKRINQGIEKDGAFYLFTLRLIPAFPFFLINMVMGLTPMKTLTYYIVSQLGMLPGTLVYINAGVQLSELTNLRGILSPEMLISFVLLGIFPFIAKLLVAKLKANKVYQRFQKPKHFDYNLVSIGAGSAGLVTSYIGAAVQAKVAIIERHKMGGDCLNTGCVPSKALIKSASVVHMTKNAPKYGIKSMSAEFDFADIMKRVQKVIKKIEPHDSVERYTSLGVDCILGEARIKSPWEIEVNGETITTKNITIATGARPFIPSIPGLDKIDYLTSDTLWHLRELPKKMIVLGGGPIGLELAQCFNRFGSEVSIVEMSPRIMIKEDPVVSDHIHKALDKEGVHVLTHHKAKKFKSPDTLICEHNGQEHELKFDKVLVAVGRQANVQGLGLEELGVELRPNGSIEANDFLQTNFPNIFVCGDVTGPYQLTHTAAHQAWFCAVNALFGKFKRFAVDYSVIPWATYTDPEVATVGLTETQAKEQNIAYSLTTYGLDDLDRAIADDNDTGFVRVLTPPGSDKILGATIVGAHASDLLLEFIAGMKHGFGLNKILGTIHTYPTMGEANKYVAGNWKRENAPTWSYPYLKKFHKWMRN